MGWLVCGWLATLLTACGGDAPRPGLPPVSLPADVTATPPFPANDSRPSPTATQQARAIDNVPTQPPPPIFPTATPGPTQPAYDFTATAGVAPSQLTPTAIPTGQLAFVQAGNLWLIDDTGGNRRQLTEAGDIGPDSAIVWNVTRDRAAYISRTGELWLLDLQGKRTLVFSPARNGKPAPAAKLPAPTAAFSPPASPGVTPRPTTKPALTITAPVWSSDSRYLAFSYYAEDSGPLAGGEVWLTELVGDRLNLTKIGEGFAPNWSGDGRLAFLSRAEVKQGPARPTINPTPPGTSLLPPTTRPAQADQPTEGINNLVVTTSPEPAKTASPGPTAPASAGPSIPATPTPFFVYSGTPTPDQSPTPTLNVLVLPSPTPTPTYPPVYLGTYVVNRIMTYTPASRKLTALMDSDKLPDAFYDSNNNLRSYPPAPLQGVWWSPDGRFLAFADKLSVVGVVSANASAPVIWTGVPQDYTVSDLQWLPRSDGVFYRVTSFSQPDTSQMTLLTFNNTGQAAGATGDVTNRNLIKITVLPGQKSACPELSPGGNFFSYADGTTVVLANPDGSIHSSYSDTECPAWSPFGRSFATVRKNSDRTIVLTTIDQPQDRPLIAARAVDRIYWLRSDPSSLGGQLPPLPTTPARP